MHGWCPWGVLEVPSGIVGTIHTKSNLGSTENPYFEKLADFPYMHVEMGWICPIWPSARFATKLAPMCKKPCCLAVPLIKGQKIADFPKKIFFFIFDRFFKFLVIFCRFLAACLPYFEAGMLFGGFGSTRVT